MDKKKFATRFLSIIESAEDFFKIINKKLNANKLSKTFELLIRKKIKVSELLNLESLGSKTKRFLNKKIELPNVIIAEYNSESKDIKSRMYKYI